MSAIPYNKKQNYTPEVIARIQRTIGAEADGQWGRRTVAQVRAWQRAHELTADGKVGPGTLKLFEKQWAEDEKPAEDEGVDDLPDDDDDDGDDDGDDLAAAIGEGFNYFDQDHDMGLGETGDDAIALQNDLYAFGFTLNPPKAKINRSVVKAITAFQRAALTPHRIAGYARVEVPVTFVIGKEGVVDANTRKEIHLWKEKGYRHQSPGEDFIERRVRVKKLGGTLPASSILLRDIPSVWDKPRKLHCLAAPALTDLIAACKQDIGVELKAQSGWRKHKWKSRADYEKKMIAKYGSVKKGAALMAFSSAHETGLAIDFGTGGLEAKSATTAKQKKTPAYAWLVANAYRFGFYPYKREPWHWEFPLSVRAWTTGLSDWRLSDAVEGDD